MQAITILYNYRTILREYNKTTGIPLWVHDLRVLVYLHTHGPQTEKAICTVVDYRRFAGYTRQFLLSVGFIKIEFKGTSTAKRYAITPAGQQHIIKLDKLMLSATVKPAKY